MKALFKYALRQGMVPRLAVLAVTVLINIVFGVLGYFKLWGQAGMIVAVVFSSLALCAIFLVNVIADVESFKSMFGSPEGYLSALTPVPSHKILLARTACMLVEDLLAYTVGILGVVFQALILSNVIHMMLQLDNWIFEAAFGYMAGLLGYAWLLLLIAFGLAVQKGYFHGNKAGWLLAFLVACAAAWVLSLTNFLLAPFGFAENWGPVFSIMLSPGLNAGTIIYIALTLCKIAALFWATARLMERRINL